MALNLNMRTYYKYSQSKLPILVVMHGWSSQTIDNSYLQRWCDFGFFVVAVSMRGRNGSEGTMDVSGREIHDIYDAIRYIQNELSDLVNDKVLILGYSGGGGNALAAGCKFPDTFTAIVDMFGMSDYGNSPFYGWYYTDPGYAPLINSAMGGTPEALPNNYHARNSSIAISNYSGGKLFLFHDVGDTEVDSIHSQRVVSELLSKSLTNYLLTLTDVNSAVRYIHQITYDSAEQQAAEAIWMADAISQIAWTIPASGTLTIIGYIKTKRFEIWLNEGLDAVASLVYDTATDTYTLTPMTTANISVTITQGNKTASGIAPVGQSTQFIVT